MSIITQPNKAFLLLIIILALFFRLYNLENRYSFDWDQEDDAVKVTQMIKTKHPRLLGPRVAGEEGFFVGPQHYYFLIPFYLLTKQDPIAGAYASVFIGILTTIVYYLISQKLFNRKIGLFASFIFAINPILTSWNVMYAPLISLLIFFLCLQILNGQTKYYPFLFFAFSFSATTHLVPASLIIPVIFSLLVSPKPNKKTFFISLFVFFIPLLPLIIFDFRNDFLNLKTIFTFIQSRSVSQSVPNYFLRSFFRSLNIFLPFVPDFIGRLLALILLPLSITLFTTKKTKLFYLIWILTPLVLLSQYHASIPEYYYGMVTALLPLLISFFVVKLKQPLLIITIILIFLLELPGLFTKKASISLKVKKDTVQYLSYQTRDQPYNVSFDLPLGWHTGYNYLFSYYRNPPQEIPQAHLYSIYLLSEPATGELVYENNPLGVVRK